MSGLKEQKKAEPQKTTTEIEISRPGSSNEAEKPKDMRQTVLAWALMADTFGADIAKYENVAKDKEQVTTEHRDKKELEISLLK